MTHTRQQQLIEHLRTIQQRKTNDNIKARIRELNQKTGQSLVRLARRFWNIEPNEMSPFLDIYTADSRLMTQRSVNFINRQVRKGTMPKEAAMTLIALSHIQNIQSLLELLPQTEYEFVCEYLLDHISPIVEERDKQPPTKEKDYDNRKL